MRRSYQLLAFSYKPVGGYRLQTTGCRPCFTGRRLQPVACSLWTPVPAFSLVEMMIAIMILGLGMVMAATVFPVSLDMTKGTLQLNISQTAADVAAATLAIRVPRAQDLSPNRPLPYPLFERLALPDMTLRELVDADLDDDDMAAANPGPIDGWTAPTGFPPPIPSPIPAMTNGRTKVRTYAEVPFWDAAWSSASLSSAYVVAAQNVHSGATGISLITEVPPMPTVSTQSYPRISIADRVYPPVDIVYDMSGAIVPSVREEIANRRYCWTAIHFRDLTVDLTQSSFFCQIVVMYRSNLDGRYLRQDPSTYPQAGSVPPVQAETSPANDTMFPQAWLVAATTLDGASGVITCKSDVAQLLPENSYVIMADLVSISGATVTIPGAFTKILKNNWDRLSPMATLQTPMATLQIKPGEFGVSTIPVRMWVFPPAAVRAGGIPQFETVSPVIDVVSKKVIAG